MRRMLWVCTICSGFEPDPVRVRILEPDLHRIFEFQQDLKKLWTDFDEILCVDSCGGLHDLVRF